MDHRLCPKNRRSESSQPAAWLVFAALTLGCGTRNESDAGAQQNAAGSTPPGTTMAGARAETAGSGAAGTMTAGSGGAGGQRGAATVAGRGADAAGSGAPSGGAGSAGMSGSAGNVGAAGASGAASQNTGPGRACHSLGDWTAKPDDLWISPTGNDVNAGTEASPKQSLTAAIASWSAGKTIWVAPGTYAHAAPIELSMKATADGPLRISGVTAGAMPMFDFSGEARSSGNGGQRGFEISGSHVHLRFLEIANAADNCVYVTGADNNLEWLRVHECQDTGVQISNGASGNNVLNVDSYLNADPSGENADGFAPKLAIGANNYFCGTRSYQNADDGYDCWSSGDSSPVKFEYCWAFGQPGPTATANGDGNGFKLGSPASRASGGNAPHELIDCYAFHNRSVGFTANGNNSGDITCTRCGEWENGAAAWSSGTGGKEPQHTGDITNLDVTVEEAMNAPRDAMGDLPDIATL